MISGIFEGPLSCFSRSKTPLRRVFYWFCRFAGGERAEKVPVSRGSSEESSAADGEGERESREQSVARRDGREKAEENEDEEAGAAGQAEGHRHHHEERMGGHTEKEQGENARGHVPWGKCAERE